MIAFFGALAFARYDWRGRSLYQKLVLLPIFFPQSVLGLALLLWFNALGLTLSWQTAVFAHLVWVVPVVTLVISIQVYSFDPALEEAAFDLGASRWQVFREVTLPVLFPGIFSGCLFAFLLSWGNFPLSLYTTGADTTVPEFLYAKMVAGYTPGVPVLGTVATIGAIVILLGGYGLMTLVLRARTRAARAQPERGSSRGRTRMLTSVAGQIGRRHRREQGHRQGHRRASSPGTARRCWSSPATPTQAEATAKELGNGASAFAADVTKLADLEAMAKTAAERHGGIDILCANAGIFPQARIEDMSPEQWDEVLGHQPQGHLPLGEGLRALPEEDAAPAGSSSPRRSPGRSPAFPAGRITARRSPGQLGFLRTASIELAKYGITVNAVMPGNIITEGLEGLGADYLKTMAASIPLKRLGTVEDIGYAALFLASKEAGYITGQTIVVDGGQILPESLEALKD